VFDIKTGQLATAFETDGAVQSLSFSENGTWLASASKGSTNVQIWDLRKQASIKTLDFGAAVSQIQWDYSAQFLAIVGGGAISIQSYQKSNKSWTELLKRAIKSRKVAWDPLGQHLLVDSDKGIVEFKR
jgi:pre-mRNA-processing factor 19